ncbi:MAG: O-antigen ligase family protein [Candidatus Omnitrophica bacterium]|nr:O-antigen ligase family protein [Candidatus Omnitrophota bacterium]
MHITAVKAKIDNIIRFLFYVMILFIPYSKAAVETSVVISCLLWTVKHSLTLVELRSKGKRSASFIRDLGHAFCPAHNVLNKGIAAFLLVCFLSIVGSELPLQSLHGFFTKTIEGYAIYLIVLEVFVIRRQVNVAIAVFMATAFATGLDTLLQYYVTHQDLFRQRTLVEGYRATGAFQHPNLLGAFLTVAIPVALSLFFSIDKKSKSKPQKIYLAAVSFVLVWALFLTFSRGAWMGTAIGMIFFVLVMVGNKVKPWVRCMLMIFAVVAGCLAIGQAFELKKQMNVTKDDSVTAEWRIALWREGFYLIKERPFFGHGLNTFMPVMENHLISTQNPLAVGYSASYAHNCYLQMAVEVGVLGLSGFLAIIFLLFQTVLKSLPPAKDLRCLMAGLLAGLLAFLVHSAVDINFYSVELPLLFWLMAGFAISLDKQLSDKTSYAIK